MIGLLAAAGEVQDPQLVWDWPATVCCLGVVAAAAACFIAWVRSDRG